MEESSGKRILPIPRTSRAARGLLGWTQGDLAKKANVARATIERFEQGLGPAQEETLIKIADCFALRGVFFTNGNKEGVEFDRTRAVIPEV